MSNPFCGPRPCLWSCGEGTPPPPVFECDVCTVGTIPNPLPFRIPVNTFGDQVCAGCSLLEGDRYLPMTGVCYWELVEDIDICGAVRPVTFRATLSGSTGWLASVIFDNPFYQVDWSLAGVGSGIDCSQLFTLTYSFAFGTACFANITGTTFLNFSTSAGAMQADCPPVEYRRGKPVVPKGKLPGR